MHLHCRFYLETDSDRHPHCRFYLKTGSDVHAPLYKTNCQPHTSIPTHPRTLSVSFLTFHSHFSRHPLSLSLRDLVMAPAFFNGIDMLSSNILSIFIFIFLCILHLYIFLFVAFDLYLIMLPHFTWKNFFVHIFYVHIVLYFIDQVV